jgi:uroporphyrinogen III methyltransferase/synthase
MTVRLVGAGPGDPGLITVRALELIAAADVIVYDRLIPETALECARPDARLIYVGKEAGGHSMAQAEIERLLVECGSAGLEVVRLKGGDPFVFGRGAEEAEALRAAGIAYEVVPGVTAGVAAPAHAGIPLTYRDSASAVALLTGHEDPEKDGAALDWRALAAFPGTLVVYMGVRRLRSIARCLLEGGRDPDQPAAVVERGTFPDQRVLTGTLATIAQAAEEAQVAAPAILVFGTVAALRSRLAWAERRPLAGVTVAVTRARAQAGALSDRLRRLGAAVIEAPAIRIEPIDGPLPELSAYDLVCLTSVNGVQALFARLRAAGLDARALAGAHVAAIGPGTAAALAGHGVLADLVPERFVAEGLLEALGERPVSRALIARAEQARDVLPQALRDRGAAVDVLALYRTLPERLDGPRLAAVVAADYVTFTSSSTVRSLLASLGGAGPDGAAPSRGDKELLDALGHARLASIGPVTSETLREHGLRADVEAERHDIEGLVQALLADVKRRRAADAVADGVT